MKLTVFILIAAIMQVSAAGFAQKVTLNKNEVPLSEVFQEIHKQTAYNVLWEPGKLRGLDKVNARFKNSSIEDVMNFCLAGTPLSYTIKENTIVIKEKENSLLDVMVGYLKSIDVKGIVVDENGNPLIGATVRIKNGNKAVITNASGEFLLSNVDQDVTLLVSYIGYETKEIKISSEPVVVKLVPNKSKLDEVVVQAYGTTTRRLNTGNIGKISAADIANQPVTNPLAALDGRIPGLVVTQSSGLPGGAFKVELRGRTAIDRTITDDQPLFVIDGIPAAANNSSVNILGSALYGGISPLNGINAQDIESIEVLKDADATAIYGSRGANGVILITTKKGKSGKTKVDFNTYAGFNQVAKTIPMYNTQQYVAMRKTAFQNDGEDPGGEDPTMPDYSFSYDFMVWDTTRYTDFNKLLARNTAHTNDADLSISGGNDRTQFLIAGDYHRESTVLGGNLADKNASMHFNINHSSENQRFKVAFSGNYSADNNHLISSDLAGYYDMPPNLQLYDENGNLAWNEGGYRSDGPLSNPLGILKQAYIAKTNNLTGNMQISYAILKELVLRTNLGYNTIQTDETSISPISGFNPELSQTNSSNFGSSQFVSHIVEPQLEYSRQFKKYKLNVLIGGSIQATDNNSTNIYASGYSNEALMYSLTGNTTLIATKAASEYRYAAIFGRINFNWQDKYLVNLTARRDGSSRFGSDKLFANFGSAGAGWIFSNEQFLKDKISWLSFGKLRGSYGITGNDKILDYQYLDTWASTPNSYNNSPGFYPDKLYNSDYRWERTAKLEGGLELGFLKDRLLTTVSYYSNSSSNQLVNYKLPNITGFTSVIENLPAKIKNTGWEFTFTTANINTKDFSWTTNANISFPKNRLVSFPDLQNSSYKNDYVEGQSLNLINKYKYLGVDPQTGLSTFEDKLQDGIIDENDRYLSGDTDPRYYGGIQNSIRYKKFTLDFFFSFRKQTGLTYLAGIGNPPGTQANIPAIMTDFWTGPGDQAQYQVLSQNYGVAYTTWSNLLKSNAVYGDASFIRLKNVSLSYNLPAQWLGKLQISNARIYLQGQNLLTITGYKLGDPETQSINVTPPLRILVAGLSFTL